MNTKYLLMVALLVGCSTGQVRDLPYWYEDGLPRFEWVEPLIFQHNLAICRSADVCRAETLFD